ncbi:hypothetical protein A3I45_01810 [Candidatus Uhrbacteria bacterium RIFCSPLOWO2_02_FULL_53_10]|nr:MAG: hypothetical protein A3I45_01810 [Candidatus Uhrbacteria bacterium RIFCSPLOWO2_02_FULL_53_10]
MAIGLVTIVLCVQGALLWHIGTMDADMHSACPVSLITRSGCVDTSNIVDTLDHHLSLFANLITSIPTSGTLIACMMIALAWALTLTFLFGRPPSDTTTAIARAHQQHVRFQAVQKLNHWFAALRLQGIGVNLVAA